MAQDLINKRGRAMGAMTKLKTFADAIDGSTSAEEIEVRLSKMEDYYKEFVQTENKLLLLENQTSKFDEFEQKYFSIKAILVREFRKLQPHVDSQPTNNDGDILNRTIDNLCAQQRNFFESLREHSFAQTSQDVRLPRITIEPFSGNYSHWPSFKDLYKSSVHNNEALSDAHKFQLLKSFLKGEAADLIRHIPITDLNYPEVWDKLLSRYDKKKSVVNSLIDKFVSQKSMYEFRVNDLRRLADVSDGVVRELKCLGTNSEKRDPWLIYLLLNKLDSKTKEEWATHSVEMDSPSFNEFLTFINRRCDAFESCSTVKPYNQNPRSAPMSRYPSKYTASHHITTDDEPSCPCCDMRNHPLYKCYKFKKMNVANRSMIVKNSKTCPNCLNSLHSPRDCPSRFTCRICGESHNTLLHENSSFDKKSQNPANINTPSSSNCMKTSINTIVTPSTDKASRSPVNPTINPAINMSSGHTISQSTKNVQTATTASPINLPHSMPAKSQAYLVQHPSLILLPTCLIKVRDAKGEYQQFRALLDSGAQSSLISEKCVQSLNLPRNHACLSIKGLSSVNAGQTKGQVQLDILPTDGFSLAVRAYVLNNLTSRLPQVPVDLSKYNQIKSLALADQTFDRPGLIDILLGSDVFFQVLRSERFQLDHNLFAQNTCFGFVIAGDVSQSTNLNATYHCGSILTHHVEIHEMMKKFWELEDVAFPDVNEDSFCETHYKQNTFKDVNTNKYVVKLPVKPNSPSLGNSLPMALKRMFAMEKRFERCPTLKEEYVRFMREYISLGHMTRIPQVEIDREPNELFYFPHHAVFKESSSTTKIRVVFDGSSKSTSGVSLNDILDPGPSIIQELFEILVRFRKHKIGFVADAEKMFRQVIVHESDRDLQRIVWRENADQPIGHYRCNTVTYGTAPATFLAVRTLHQIADDLPAQFSDVKSIIKTDFYVDDLLSGAHTVSKAKILQTKIVDALKTGGFRLRKWVSNSEEMLSSIPEGDREALVEFGDGDFCVKTLGLIWINKSDYFTFKINHNSGDDCNTKRKLLSTTSSIFDPLGFLAPCTVAAKILFQNLWLHKLDWDDQLPENLNFDWQALRSKFTLFEKIQIPRFLAIPSNPQRMELHGFSDASEKAYAATVYLRSVDPNGITTVSLVAAKTKVAPLKKICLPRLELCGAVLLVNLMRKLVNSLEIPDLKMFGWTDSTIVLAWLSGEPARWKTFIANRVSHIIGHLPRQHWDHVPSELNPADCASRGITPDKLIVHTLWWNGPDFLRYSSKYWPKLNSIQHGDVDANGLELKNASVQTVVVNSGNIKDDMIELLFNRINSFSRLVRLLAQCFRFFENFKTKIKSFYLTAHHVNSATMVVVRWAQLQSFGDDIKRIKNGLDLNRDSKLKSLCPFIDENGTLRVGGRIGLTTCCSFDAKHPAILDKNHPLTIKLVGYLHLCHLHPAQQQLLAIIRQKYWIVGAKYAVRQIARGCMTCIRYQIKTSQQRMGDLPNSRITPSRPFSSVGVDFAGPVMVKSRTGRGAVITKGYIAVFVCLVVKAIHIEIVCDLSTDAFLACLRRFISRRGLPNKIFSDNGSNFIGAKRRINQLHETCSKVTEEDVRAFLSQQSIEWHLIPPASPHFGGMWEAGVKSVKRHLIRSIGETSLTFEEYSTVLCQIECLLNSRPISPMDPTSSENSEILTPGHFIMGSSPLMLPEPPTENEPRSFSNRWQLLQNLMRGFWRLWRTDYLTSLQKRHKWKHTEQNFRTGQIVLLKDENAPPGRWPKGIIEEVHPGKDGLVRIVTIRTLKGTYKRPITKICRIDG